MNETTTAAGTTSSGRPAASPAELTPMPALTVLAHPDPAMIGARYRWPPGGPTTVEISRQHPKFSTPATRPGRPLTDRRVSRRALVVRATVHGARWERGSSGSTVRLDGEPLEDAPATFTAEALRHGVVVELAGTVVLMMHLARANADGPDYGLVGASDAMLRLRADIGLVVAHEVPTLLLGESGTGKELVAQAVHHGGARAGGPWVSVNMAALPASTAVSQLFGHSRGAFTGAQTATKGYFATADRGTLFLDEVGELPGEVQAMLLRALETGEVQPLGHASTRQVDVRVIAATDRDLEAAARTGSFNAPLFHRLAGFQVRLPPLRERREDIGLLVRHFSELEHPELPQLPPWLIARFARFDWPGNVRQLRNLVREARLLASAGQLDPADPRWERLTSPVAAQPAGEATASETPVTRALRPADVDEEMLREALASANWEPAEAARALGISRTSIYALMNRYRGIRTPQELSEADIREALDAVAGDARLAAGRLTVSYQGLLRRMRALGLDPRG